MYFSPKGWVVGWVQHHFQYEVDIQVTLGYETISLKRIGIQYVLLEVSSLAHINPFIRSPSFSSKNHKLIHFYIYQTSSASPILLFFKKFVQLHNYIKTLHCHNPRPYFILLLFLATTILSFLSYLNLMHLQILACAISNQFPSRQISGWEHALSTCISENLFYPHTQTTV